MADVAAEYESVPVLALTAALGAVVILISLLVKVMKKSSVDLPQSEEPHENGKTEEKKVQQQAKKQKSTFKQTKAKTVFSHPWLAGTLKGHGAKILGIDFSSNGKYLISCAEDRSIFLWSVKEFTQREHKFVRANVELDHAKQVKFSPDCRAFIVGLHNGNAIRVFKIGKKADGSPGNISVALEFPDKSNHVELLNIGISSSGRFIMSCYKNTIIHIWDLKGELLGTIDTHQVNNSFGMVSPCGRFVASSGFTPDVKVWEVVFDKSSNFKEISRAFELKGHSAGIYNFAFNDGSTRMATISKDGTWKYWKTDVLYQNGQDPYLLNTGTFTHSGPSLIALSTDGLIVAIATSRNVYIYKGQSGEMLQSIEDLHADSINNIAYDISGKYFITSGDRQIHVFHNVPGYEAKMADLEEKKTKNSKTNTAAQKERINQQIEEARNALKAIAQK